MNRPARAGLAGWMVVALLAGCGRPAATDHWFPLEAGHRWEYRLKTERENQAPVLEAMVLTSHGPQALDSGTAWRRRSDSGVEYFLREDASGIYRVASKSDLDAEPLPDKEPRYVLKLPLKPGSEWRATTVPYLLERRAEFPREIRHSHAPVVMTYTLQALGEAVETPAGRFADCLRVQGRATLRLFADPVAGWRDMPLVTTEWYCRGVGLVKLTREEPAQSAFLTGGVLTMELMEWR